MAKTMQNKRKTTFYCMTVLCSMIMIGLSMLLLVVPADVKEEKKPLTLKTGSSEAEYSSLQISNDEYEISGEIKDGHRAEVTFSGKQIDVGISLNLAELKIFDETDEDVSGMYDISYDFGILSVTPRELVISSGSKSERYYDGIKLEDHSYEIVSGEIASGDEITVSYYSEQSTIGQSDNYFSVSVTNIAGGKDVTDNYRIICEFGTLTVYR